MSINIDLSKFCIDSIGSALSSADGVVRLMGLWGSFMGELIYFPEVNGAVLNLETDVTGVAVLGSEDSVRQTEVGKRSYREVLLAVGVHVLNCVIDPLGNVFETFDEGGPKGPYLIRG